MKKMVFLAALATYTALLTPSAQAKEIVYEEASSFYIVVQSAPPADQAEVVPTSPGSGYLWMRGHWKWEGNQWAWEKGRWANRPHPNALWVPGYWHSRQHGWVWISGHWG